MTLVYRTRFGYVIDSWKDCRREPLAYRIKAAWASWKYHTTVGPELTWSM